MLNTFGLSGRWSYDKIEHCNVEFVIKPSKINKKKYSVYFCDMRNFGTIEFTDDINILNKKLNKLADDLLQNNYSEEEFYNNVINLKNQKKNIYAVLMTQNKGNSLGSGLGNYLVAEILYRAKISPHRIIKQLSKKDIFTLSKTIKYVLKLCYLTNNTEYVSHLSSFLKKHNKYVNQKKFPEYHSDINIEKNTFDFKVYRRKFDDDDNPIIGDELIKGRTIYWCPAIQK
jgi:formamidopyrimidine-DNA glycosylase